jgi:hypothetical protein
MSDKVKKKLAITHLPIEIVYNIMDFMNPFDILNFSNVLSIKPCKKFDDEIGYHIEWFCSGNKSFMCIIKNIIRDKCLVDYDIFNILDSIVYIIKKSSKYMDVLGFSNYIFNIKGGKSFISKYAIPIIHKDTQIINIEYPDPNVLIEYLEKYLNFKTDQYSIYKIKKYNIKYLIN